MIKNMVMVFIVGIKTKINMRVIGTKVINMEEVNTLIKGKLNMVYGKKEDV